MKTASRFFLAVIGFSVLMPTFAEQDPNITTIKARQGEMNIRAHNLGPLIAMAKGDMPYDAQLAAQLAANLKFLLDLDTSRFWPPGTDSNSYPGNSKALPEIWTTYPEIGKYAEKHDKAVIELDAVAGEGLEALRSKIGAVGDSCKGCHDEYAKEH